MFHHLQVYLRKDRDLHIRFSKSPSTLAQSDSRKLRLETGDKTTTPNHPAPLIRSDPQPDDSSSPMAQDMRGHSWRSSAVAHLSSIKDHITHRVSDPQATHHHHLSHFFHSHLPGENGYDDGDAKKHSLPGFAKRSHSYSDGVTSAEKVVLLPGWASRRYRAGPELHNRPGTISDHFLY
jgi:hypothetical protein